MELNTGGGVAIPPLRWKSWKSINMSVSKDRYQGNLLWGLTKEPLDSPESVIGSPSRIPSIVGQGAGRGFTFDGLRLPIDWKNSLALKQFKWEPFYYRFARRCEADNLAPGEINVDPKTRLMTRIKIKNQPEASVKLSDDSLGRQNGVYKAENVNDIQSAIVLQATAAEFLQRIGLGNYPYIEGMNGRHYYSSNLSIPQSILATNKPITDEYRKEFKKRARNIATTFGVEFQDIEFNEQGILTFVKIEGDACNYSYDKEINRYSRHNVGTARQAVTLHGIIASFINDRLDFLGQEVEA